MTVVTWSDNQLVWYTPVYYLGQSIAAAPFPVLRQQQLAGILIQRKAALVALTDHFQNLVKQIDDLAERWIWSPQGKLGF